LGQGIGTLAGLLVAFALTFLILSIGVAIPPEVIDPTIISDFLSRSDLELKLVIISTVLYPTTLSGVNIGIYIGYGARGSEVLMFLVWGTGGLVAGLLSRDIVQGLFAALFAVIIGAFLSWLLIFFVQTTDYAAIIGGESMLILQVVLEGALYPAIASVVGGLLGGGISRPR